MHICTIEDCGTEIYAKGWCNKHYQRFRRNGHPEILRRNPVLSMSEADIAWLAGLLEGEGSFFMTGRGDYYYPTIVVSMTDRDVVERVSRMFGTGIYAQKQDKRYPNAKIGYRTQTTGHKAAGLMEQLLPWMGERRSQKIKELLNTQVERVERP